MTVPGSGRRTARLKALSSSASWETTNPGGSIDGGIATAAGRLFFTVEDMAHGSELWSSDGTAAGTKMVKDITPGPDSTYIVGLTGIGSSLYFSAGGHLWKSDGTEAGTVLVSDQVSPAYLVNLNGTLYFAGTDPAHGSELWKSDGTPGGTVLVRDILPDAASSSPQGLLAIGGVLYFRLESDGSTWRSDGTEAGTTLVHSLPSTLPFVPSGNRFFFKANESQLWTSDGTSAGTVMIGDFGKFFYLDNATAVPGALLFWVCRSVVSPNGIELWRSDGTPAGTTLVKVVEPGASVLASIGSAATTNSTIHILYPGIFLWRSDGTPEGTVRLHGPVSLSNGGSPDSLIDANGTLFCAAVDEEHGRELWKSDGTPEGTSLVSDVQPGPVSSYPEPSPRDPFDAPLHGSDCRIRKKRALRDRRDRRRHQSREGPRAVVGLLPEDTIGILGNVFLFISGDDAHGMEPWRSDGTPDGTYILGDLTPGATSSSLGPLGVLKRYVLLHELRLRHQRHDPLEDRSGRSPAPLLSGRFRRAVPGGVAVGDVLVFVGRDPEHGVELWKTDGTASGTSLLFDINPAGDFWPYFEADDMEYDPPEFLLERVGNRLLFWADDGVHGIRPWVTDGTSAGTTFLKDIQPYLYSSRIDGTALLGSTRYFWAHDGLHGFELWKTDGTSAGTSLVRDITPGACRLVVRASPRRRGTRGLLHRF